MPANKKSVFPSIHCQCPLSRGTIDICINNVILKALCSPPKQLCPDPEEAPTYWKTGAGELWRYWIPVIRSTKWDGGLDVVPVR